MDRKALMSLAPIVARPEWDVFLVQLMNMKNECHERLECCPSESLKGIQGELTVINRLLTLRDAISKLRQS